MPRRTPLTAIFDPPIRYGSKTPTAQIGTRAPRRLAIGTALEVDTAGAAFGVQTIHYGSWAHSTTSGTNPPSTLFWPFTPTIGDVALIFLTNSNGTPGPTLTDFGAPVHNGDRCSMYRRVVDGSETLTGYNVVVGSSAKHCSIIIVVRGLSGFTDRGFASSSILTGYPVNITYPTITPTGQPTWVFYSVHDSVTTFTSPSLVNNPGGSNPTPVQLTDSGPIPPGSAICRSVIWVGKCTSTSALGNRVQPPNGMGSNYYHGATWAIAA